MDQKNQNVKRSRESGLSRSIDVAQSVAGSVIVTGDKNIAVHTIGAGRDFSVSEISPREAIEGRTITGEQAFERIASAVKLNLTQIESNIEQA